LITSRPYRPFLLGYFDGDGSAFKASKGRHGWNVCSGSEQVLIDLKQYVRQQTSVVMGEDPPPPGFMPVSGIHHGPKRLDRHDWLHRDGLGLPRKQFAPELVARYQV
jgi:hypothetical protein